MHVNGRKFYARTHVKITRPRVNFSTDSQLWRAYVRKIIGGVGGGGDTPNNGLYEEAPPKRGTFFRLPVYERVGNLLVEVYEKVGKSVIFNWVCESAY